MFFTLHSSLSLSLVLSILFASLLISSAFLFLTFTPKCLERDREGDEEWTRNQLLPPLFFPSSRNCLKWKKGRKRGREIRRKDKMKSRIQETREGGELERMKKYPKVSSSWILECLPPLPLSLTLFLSLSLKLIYIYFVSFLLIFSFWFLFPSLFPSFSPPICFAEHSILTFNWTSFSSILSSNSPPLLEL